MSVISNTLRKYAERDGSEDIMLASVLKEVADELDRKDAVIAAIKKSILEYDTRLMPNEP